MKYVLLVVLLLAPACAKAPPTLGPAGVTAFYQTRAIKAFDVLRDIAVDANAQIPPRLSTATTRKVVLYHEATVRTIHAVGNGWQAVATAGLEDLTRSFTPAEQQLLAPYVALARTILLEVTR